MDTVIKLYSFGWGFLAKDEKPPPAAELVEDVRKSLRNPPSSQLLKLDGKNRRLQRFVRKTPGADAFIAKVIAFVEGLPSSGPRRVAVGCVAGRHRSVALVEIIAKELRRRGHRVVIVHIHLTRALANEPLGA